jgi:uncharacterized membrane protein
LWGEVRAAVQRHKMALGLLGLAHVAVFMFLFGGINHASPYSTGLYFDYASQLTAGAIPYRDFAIEYPPLALLFFLMPQLAADTLTSYAVAFAVQTLVFSLLGLFLVILIARRLELVPWQSALAYSAFLVAIGPLVSRRYDIFPAVLVLLALYAFLSSKYRAAYILLAAGAVAKVYPAFLFPILLLHRRGRSSWRRVMSDAAIFAGTGLVSVLPFFIASPAGLWDSLTYHARRGIQVESVYSSILLVGHKLGWLSVTPEFSFGSWNLTGGAADITARMALLVMPLSLLAIYRAMYRHVRTTQLTMQTLVHYLLLATIVVVLTGKVLSPEYLVWLAPLVALSAGKLKYWLWAVFLAAGAVTQSIEPLTYNSLIHLDPGVVVLLLLRNVLVVLMAVIVAMSLQRDSAAAVDHQFHSPVQ